MTSQPLETIPEAPTPAPAPARVTADPPKTKPAKNPGRVASGKKLAERNRLGREALARETLKAEAEAKAKAKAAEPSPTKTEDSASDVTVDSSSLSLGAMLGIGSLIVGVAGLYYQRESIMARLNPAPPPPEPAPAPAPSRIPVKRGIKKWNKFKNTIYILLTMEDFARGAVAGFAVSMTIPAMYYFNKAALGTLFAINKEIGKALARLIVRPPPPEIEYVPMKHTCNDDDCTIVCCFCDSDHYSCYDCEKENLKP